MPKIHFTAMVDKNAVLGDDVEIGPFCIVESDVRIGAGTVLRSHAVVRRYSTLGEGNFLDSGVVIGGEPQDLKFDAATRSEVVIGDKNTFREHVTINRATGEGNRTTVGSRNYWMANAHSGHNSSVGDDVILVNNATVAGHAEIGRGAILSADVGIHQFCWVGEMVMSQGHAGSSCHVPPYCLIAGINYVVGLNSVGLRRAPHISDSDRRQIKEAFALTWRRGLTPKEALAEMDRHDDWGAAAGVFREFIRRVVSAEGRHKRPLPKLRMNDGGSVD